MQIIIQIIIAIILAVAAYMLAPKPKGPTNSAARDLDAPTVSAGRPVPVVFGTVICKSLNVLWFGEKNIIEYKVDA
ncbi:hypothetical protein GOD54_23645 [Sinorhizobium medicae]|nr:hypothetical protein [Sinorhizobium medicae]